MNNDLNSVIEQITSIDASSETIMQNTQIEKSKYAEIIKKQTQEFDTKLQSEIDNSVSSYKDSLITQNQETIKQYEKDCHDDIAKLEDSFEKNGTHWVDMIFNNIVKG